MIDTVLRVCRDRELLWCSAIIVFIVVADRLLR